MNNINVGVGVQIGGLSFQFLRRPDVVAIEKRHKIAARSPHSGLPGAADPKIAIMPQNGCRNRERIADPLADASSTMITSSGSGVCFAIESSASRKNGSLRWKETMAEILGIVAELPPGVGMPAPVFLRLIHQARVSDSRSRPAQSQTDRSPS
jgi:hypothetical protein